MRQDITEAARARRRAIAAKRDVVSFSRGDLAGGAASARAATRPPKSPRNPVDALERRGDSAYAAFAMRIRIAIHLARREYAAIALIAERAVKLAQSSGDDYVHVQVLNVLGAFHFDRATSKLPEHARSHLSSLDPAESPPI